MTRPKNRRIMEEAKDVFVGGVNSPVRSFKHVDGQPVPIKRGHGSRIYDYDGKSYIDYVLSYGGLILGHAHPYVVDETKKALGYGSAFGATNEKETELGRVIKDAIPFIDKIRFVNSGTEAVMGAVRLARGCTGREYILKFSRSYHGHADYLLAGPGPGGVPASYLRTTLTAEYGDIKEVEAIFERYGELIAAVIVEPVGGNDGVVGPDTVFLKALRLLSRRYGALLIFDEVITAFRFSFGAAADFFGIRPDIICLGKIIGGGLPIGAFAGPSHIMEYLAPDGKVYQASTFAGNPVVMASGTAALTALKKSRCDYSRIFSYARRICESLQDVETSYFGPMFSIRFHDKKRFARFYKKALSDGVYLAPSEHESNFISFSHTEKDIEKTISVLRHALKR